MTSSLRAVPAIIKSFDGFVPQIGEDVFLADGAVLVGHVELGAHSSVWYQAVLRGDLGPIRIGEYSTVQDLACLHMKKGGQNVEIGNYVAIGHGAVIHGARIDDGVFVGNGCIIMEKVHIGENCVIAAGSVIARGTIVPPGTLVRGRPARVVKELDGEALLAGRREAELQHELALKSE